MADVLTDISPASLKEKAEKEMGARFIEFPPLPPDIPRKFDLEKYGQDAEAAGQAISGIMLFINAPIIPDKFTIHDEREEKRFSLYDEIKRKHGEEAADKFNELLTNNKLKRNTSGMILAGSVELLEEITGTSPESTSIRNMIKDEVSVKISKDPNTGERIYHDPWNDKDIDQKKAVLADLTNLSVQLLKNLANK